MQPRPFFDGGNVVGEVCQCFSSYRGVSHRLVSLGREEVGAVVIPPIRFMHTASPLPVYSATSPGHRVGDRQAVARELQLLGLRLTPGLLSQSFLSLPLPPEQVVLLLMHGFEAGGRRGWGLPVCHGVIHGFSSHVETRLNIWALSPPSASGFAGLSIPKANRPSTQLALP